MLVRTKRVVFAFLLVFLFSCNTDKICNENRSTFLRIGYYIMQKIDGIQKINAISIDTITVYGLERPDSLIYNKIKASKLVLPLSQLKDTSVFEVKISGLPDDNYIITYKRSNVFVNYECGFRTDYEIDTIFSAINGFDSISFNTRIVTDVNEEHIKIFFQLPDSVTPTQP